MKNILTLLFVFLYSNCFAQKDSAFVEINYKLDSIANSLSRNDILLSNGYAAILKDHAPDNNIYFRKRAYQDLIELSKKICKSNFGMKK